MGDSMPHSHVDDSGDRDGSVLPRFRATDAVTLLIHSDANFI